MAARKMTDYYAVLGNPIKHSLSPQIHRQFATLDQSSLSYDKLEAPLEGFADFVQGLHDRDYQGLNVTMPFKLDAFALAESLSTRAEQAGAVNTLIRTSTGWTGDNTDGIGLVNDLQALIGDELSDLKILILGAGGSVQGIVPALLEHEPSSIHIANRTTSKAQKLAEHFGGSITASGLEHNFTNDFDLLINATASGLNNEVPALQHRPVITTACYDLFYAAQDTAFLQWCKSEWGENLLHADGLGMLVRQAAASYQLWRQTEISERIINEVIQSTRQAIAGA